MARSPRRDYVTYRAFLREDLAREFAKTVRDARTDPEIRVRVRWSHAFGYAVQVGIPR